jgi:hypothetical protein
MLSKVTKIALFTGLFVGSVNLLATQAEVCVPQPGSPTICVAWTNFGEPEPDQNFEIQSFDPAAPTVLLNTGSNWTVYSKSEADPNLPGAIGDIRFDFPEDMTLLLARPDGTPAASRVGSIDLRPVMAHGAAILPGSIINGDVLGDIVTRRGGTGSPNGAIDLEVTGDVIGSVSAPIVERLVIGGSLAGGVREALSIGELTVGADIIGIVISETAGQITVGGHMTRGAIIHTINRLTIGGNANGVYRFYYVTYPGLIDIGGDLDEGILTVREELIGSVIRVRGNVTKTATVGIDDMVSYCPPPGNPPQPCISTHSSIILNEVEGDTWGNIPIAERIVNQRSV